jgi:transposase
MIFESGREGPKTRNLNCDGYNYKIQSIKANARGYRNFENYRVAILFYCGKLSLYP